jgi:hypothetical protein
LDAVWPLGLTRRTSVTNPGSRGRFATPAHLMNTVVVCTEGHTYAADVWATRTSLTSLTRSLPNPPWQWRAKCEAIEKREAERHAAGEKKHAEEVAYLQRAHKQLKQQLETFLAPGKKP